MELKTQGFNLVKDNEYQAVSTLVKQVPELVKCIRSQISQIEFGHKTPEEQKNSLAKFRRVLGEVQETLNAFNGGKGE